MNLDIIMLGGFLSIIQEHMLLLWRIGIQHMYNTTGKHSETDVVEEVFVDQLGLPPPKNLEKLYRNRSSG
jgi:hypothetical protein